MAISIWSSGIANAPTVELVVNQQSQDIGGNYSVLAYSLILHRPLNVTSSASKSYAVNINGVTVASGTTTIGGSGDKTIASGTTTVYHDSNGEKIGVPFNFYMDIGITWSGQGTGNASGSGSMNLTTIPRTSSGSMSNPSPNLGDVVTINIIRGSPSFTHEVYHDWYAGSWTKITTGGKVGTSASWTIPKSFANNIPSSLSGNGRILIETYNGDTWIGNHIFEFTGNVPDTAEFKPIISSVSTSQNDPSIDPAFGAYIQNISKLKVAISDIVAYSSPITSYTTTILGVSYSGQAFTSGLLSISGQVAVVTTVTDSRGRTTTVTNYVNVIVYTSPTINHFFGYRSLSTGVQDDDDGTYLKVIMKFNVSPVNVGGVNKNGKLYKVHYKLQSEPTTWTELTSGEVYSYDSAFTSVSAILNLDSSYDIRLTVYDWFSLTTATFQVGTAFTLMDFASDGRAMAIGKVYEGLRGAILEVFGDILIQNRGADTKLMLEQLEGNAGIEIGNKDLAGVSYIDFHTSGGGNDYDARIMAEVGNGTNGNGKLSINTRQIDFNGTDINFGSIPKNDGHDVALIIETGSNANGYYVKYSDGIMIAYGRRSISGNNVNGAWGSWFIGSPIYNTFPAIFYDIPSVAANMENSTGDIAVWMNAGVRKTDFDGYFTRGVAGVFNFVMGWIAIGRWKA